MGRTSQTRAGDAQEVELKEGKAMRKITVDSKAIRFYYNGGGINCFWSDILNRRRRIFWRSLRRGFREWRKFKDGN